MRPTSTTTATADVLKARVAYQGATFTLRNRLRRALWNACWLLAFRTSPVPMRRYRLWLLRCFGAQVSMNACVYPSARIWAPWNLRLEAYASLAPRVNCYNIAKVTIGQYAIASQGAHLCTGTHDYDDAAFTLYALPICLERHAWACAESFIGPGVTLHEGAVLGARAVALRDLESWSVSIGNPAFRVKSRQPR